MGSSQIRVCGRFVSLVNNYEELLFHSFFEGTGVHYQIDCSGDILCDTVVLHTPYGLPAQLCCNVSAISLLHMWLWAKLIVSLAQIYMLTLLAKLSKYHFISNERSALAM